MKKYNKYNENGNFLVTCFRKKSSLEKYKTISYV